MTREQAVLGAVENTNSEHLTQYPRLQQIKPGVRSRYRRKLRLARGQLRAFISDERGAVTAEYAILIMAAVAFAGVLVVIMRSGEVQQMLTDLVQNALNSANP